MADRWLRLENALEAQISLLAREITDMQIAGEVVSINRLLKFDRYQKLLERMDVEMARYSEWAETEIETRQYFLGRLGLQNSAEAIQISLAEAGYGVGEFFNRLPVDAVEVMVGMTGSGMPLGDLLEDAFPESVEHMTNALLEGVVLGLPPGQTARNMMDGMAAGLTRLTTIARTEQLRVYREASRQQYEASGAVREYERVCAKQPATCIACIALDGKVYPTDELMEVHPNDRCVVGGTLISGARPESLSIRNYSGDVISIKTAAGNFLTVTPNHPILTNRGWMAAKFIQKGDNVIRSTMSEQAAATIDPNNYQAETLVENIPFALGMNLFGEVPTSSEDFHGDGRGSQVHIIWTNSHLRNDFNSCINQPFSENFFCRGNIGWPHLPGFGNFAASLKGVLDTFSGFHLVRTPESLFGSHILAHQTIGLGLASEFDSKFCQRSMHHGTRYVESLGEGILGDTGSIQSGRLRSEISINSSTFPSPQSSDFLAFMGRPQKPASLEFIRKALWTSVNYDGGILDTLATEIEFDSVIEIGVRTFSGHVYNLHNKAEWYIANGIISHNCTMIPHVAGAPRIERELAGDWFAKQDPGLQKQMMGPGRFDLYDRGIVELKDMVTTSVHPIWGPSIGITNVRDLKQ